MDPIQLRVKRQGRPDSEPYWEEFTIPYRAGHNVHSLLMEVQLRPVRADGMISMPLLNDVQAAGLTPMQLAGSITDKLKKYVSDPRVTIVVTQMNSQRVYVTGEVLHPGAMNLTPNMTVLQALSSSGFTQFANTKGIYVLRHENGEDKKFPVNYKKLVKGEGGQNIPLKPGDTIIVP